MEFIRGYIGKLGKKPVTEYPPTQVVEVKSEDYAHYDIHQREDCLQVCGIPGTDVFEVFFVRDIPAKGIQVGYR